MKNKPVYRLKDFKRDTNGGYRVRYEDIRPVCERLMKDEIEIDSEVALRILQELVNEKLDYGYICGAVAEKLVLSVMGSDDVALLWRLAEIEFERARVISNYQYDKAMKEVESDSMLGTIRERNMLLTQEISPRLVQRNEHFYLRVLDRLVLLIQGDKIGLEDLVSYLSQFSTGEPTRFYRNRYWPWISFGDYLEKRGVDRDILMRCRLKSKE